MFKFIFLFIPSLFAATEAEESDLSVNNLQPLLEDIATQKTPHDASEKFQKFLEEATNLGIQAIKKTGLKIDPDKVRELKEDTQEGIITSKEIFDAPLDID